MASANFSGLARVYGEDVLQKIKGCKFHFLQSVEKRKKKLNEEQKQGFQQLCDNILLAATTAAYKVSYEAMQDFITGSS